MMIERYYADNTGCHQFTPGASLEVAGLINYTFPTSFLPILSFFFFSSVSSGDRSKKNLTDTLPRNVGARVVIGSRTFERSQDFLYNFPLPFPSHLSPLPSLFFIHSFL